MERASAGAFAPGCTPAKGKYCLTAAPLLSFETKYIDILLKKKMISAFYYRVLSNDVESTFKNERKGIILLNLQRKNRQKRKKMHKNIQQRTIDTEGGKRYPNNSSRAPGQKAQGREHDKNFIGG